MKRGLKKIIEEIMDKQGYASDDDIANTYGKEPDWRIVEIYKRQYRQKENNILFKPNVDKNQFQGLDKISRV